MYEEPSQMAARSICSSTSSVFVFFLVVRVEEISSSNYITSVSVPSLTEEQLLLNRTQCL